MSVTTSLHRAWATLCVVLALLLITSCSSGSDAGPAGEAAADNAAAYDEAAADGGADVPDGRREAASADSAVADVVDVGAVAGDPADVMMVRRVQIEMIVDDVAAAVSRARAAATTSGGWVSSEEVTPGQEERAGWATMVLRVPSKDLDTVVTGLSDLGTVTASSSQSEDVTTEYRDVEARVATLEASAERLRDLVKKAGTVESIASLERELASREADLDALKARMKVLAQDVSRSTITLHLAEDGATLAAAVPSTGFVAGLQQGWAAFTASVTVLLTAAGALLPFAIVFAAIGLPALLWFRRRRHTPTTTPVSTDPA
ncbi:MAG: DUF4349 domain-containing protein [Ornithinimicrobium sp.]|uniref:DUF4349 domain-containing protein n=1 Tax=Ornithinimicrobium sp. TaxID=1977084 RepID=UPI0026DF1FC7|nr:DUF4349 domain-containing protein [Ornithinimicrobium sp.]MDO5740091.1 DUF4349 domain-containing protein [Ornithinimicrobium sp.]